MPGIVVVTAGCARMNRKARSGSERPQLRGQLLQSIDAIERECEIRSGEIHVAKITVGPARIPGERAGETAFIKRHARDHGGAAALARGEQHLGRRLIENVVDDLHRIDQAGVERAQHVVRLPPVDTDAKGADDPGAFQIFGGALPSAIAGPRIVPHVQLQQIDRFGADVQQTGVCALHHVVVGKDLIDRRGCATGPLPVEGRHFRRDVEPYRRVTLEHLAKQPFALAVPVGQGRVKEIAAERDGAIERPGGFGVVRSGPAAHAPHAVTDLCDVPIESSTTAITHR